MNPFVLAVILTRVVGVLFVGLYLPYTVFTAMSVLFGSRAQYVNSGDWWAMVEMLVYPATSLAFGMFCMLRAASIGKFLTRGLHPEGFCQRCGYNLVGRGLARCPECGHEEAGATQADPKG